MTDQEWYEYGQEHCRIKKGDSVKVLRKAEDKEGGWRTFWVPCMDSFVGKTLTVLEDKGKYGFGLSDHYTYPFFVLELIQKKESEPPLPQSILTIILNEDFGCAKESIEKLVAEILKQK